MDKLVHKLSKYKRDPTYLCELIRAVASCANASRVARYIAENGIEPIFRILEFNYGDSMLNAVIEFLATLSSSSNVASLIVDSDLLPAVISAVSTKCESSKVAILALRVVEYLSYAGDSSRNKLRQLGAVKMIDLLRKSFFKAEDVEKRCVVATDALNGLRRRSQDHDVYRTIRHRLNDAMKAEKKLSPALINMALAGTLMQKYPSYGKPRTQHVFINKDMTRFCWKDPKTPIEKADYYKFSWISAINKGRCKLHLDKKSALGKCLAKEDLCFSIVVRDKVLAMECNSEKERDQWHLILSVIRRGQRFQGGPM